jgi:hypothetical protein
VSVLPFVVLGALCAAPAAPAATLSVDDDRQDCPAAAFTSVQAAVDAASTGDTVAICAGSYTEGSGDVGSNALTIPKSITLKGAGADLVRISPSRAGGQIATSTPSLTDGAGDVVSATGVPTAPLTVHVSGVTIDGNGVIVEAGVVFRDAYGSITRSRITNVVTSESADAYQTSAGAWRGTQPGYGIAQVTAATGPPAATAPRTLSIQNTRIDRYNRAGVLIDGGAPVDNRGLVNASEVVGRVLCQNFAADGNCSAPGLVTTGPLFGQDGVHVTDGARATVQSSIVTQNLVNGTGAPVRQTFAANGTLQNPGTDGNANLSLGAGIRLVGANAAGSLITRNNIVDNAYGVFNAAADGTTPSAVAVPAESNWWGLRFTPPPINNGPAISPPFNPPVPENPVNGAPVADGAGTSSSAVDFYPFRSGPQSDPLTGQYPNIQAPQPVSDAAPTIALAVDRSIAERGDVIRLTATAADDFGVKRVRFSDGSTPLGSVSAPPYTTTFTVPADAPCADRTLTALAEDSLGQTAAASARVSVVGPNNCRPANEPPAPAPQPPAASLPDDLNSISQSGTRVTVNPTSAVGIARVEYFLRNRLVCSLVAAPYSCLLKPGAADVGLQTLRVVITDRNGASTVLTRQVLIDRLRSRGLRVADKERRVSRNRERHVITARLRPPAGIAARDVCKEGAVALVISRRNRAFLNKQVRLRRNCTARVRFTAKRTRKRIYTVSARFAGNTVLLPASKTRRFS